MPDYRPLHSWTVQTDEARRLQRELRERVVARPPEDFSPRWIAGADMSIKRGDDRGYAAFVVIDAESLETVEEATVAGRVDFPYVPGLLSFRELPLLAQAWTRLERRPDVVVFDGHGYAHPRRFGLACHGGVLLDVPAIGCAKSLLIGEHGPLDPERGSTSLIRPEDGEGDEVLGAALRTRSGVRPVYASVGHRVDLSTAVDTLLRVAPRYRHPEPIRRSDRLVGRLRREESQD